MGNKHVQNKFKRDDLQSCFKKKNFFLTGCRLFAPLKILVVPLVTDLTSIAKSYFF